MAGAAAAVVVLVGCSTNKPGTASSGSNPPAPGAETVTVGGENQGVTAQVSCVASGDNIDIGRRTASAQ